MGKLSPYHWMIVGGGMSFVALIAAFVATEWYWGLLIPFALALVASVLLAKDYVLWFIIVSTPLSINVEFEDLGSTMNFPNEPFIVALTGLFFIRLVYYGNFYPKFVKHPLSIILIAHLTWMLFTAILSELPMVSIKYFASRLWTIVVFFYLMSKLLSENKNIKAYYLAYLIPLSIAVIYTIIHHGQYNFTKKSGTWVMQPFFKEHTSYGAVLAMYVTIAWGLAILYKERVLRKLSYVGLAVVVTLGLYFSYTRAAWLSVFLMMGIAGMLYIGWGFRRFLQLIGFGLVVLALSWSSITERLEKTRAVSSDDRKEHLSSVTNVTTDASNTERLNRWKSALRMWQEKPHTGFGPGTYMFLYAPYQNPNEKTIISTNRGDVGNAHSEYIGPLAEMGWPGSLIMIIWVILIFHYGFKLSLTLTGEVQRNAAIIAFLALITYFSHGLVNNFLDIDKAALPVFGCMAILTVLDIQRKSDQLEVE